jgi:ribosomal protein S18 acetylase RimI-like enzyme
MLRELEEFARLNYTHQELTLYVTKSNSPALKLYQSSGYFLAQEFHDKLKLKKNLR